MTDAGQTMHRGEGREDKRGYRPPRSGYRFEGENSVDGNQPPTRLARRAFPFREDATRHFILQGKPSQKHATDIKFYSTLVSSRNRCNSMKINDRVHFYSTIYRGVIFLPGSQSGAAVRNPQCGFLPAASLQGEQGKIS
jgi:hypothetical protein